MWQSGIDDGGIQDTDEGTKDGRDQHPPFIVAACTPCEWTCDPSSRHMKMGTHVCFLSPVRAPPINDREAGAIVRVKRKASASFASSSRYWSVRMMSSWPITLGSWR